MPTDAVVATDSECAEWLRRFVTRRRCEWVSDDGRRCQVQADAIVHPRDAWLTLCGAHAEKWAGDVLWMVAPDGAACG